MKILSLSELSTHITLQILLFLFLLSQGFTRSTNILLNTTFDKLTQRVKVLELSRLQIMYSRLASYMLAQHLHNSIKPYLIVVILTHQFTKAFHSYSGCQHITMLSNVSHKSNQVTQPFRFTISTKRDLGYILQSIQLYIYIYIYIYIYVCI